MNRSSIFEGNACEILSEIRSESRITGSASLHPDNNPSQPPTVFVLTVPIKYFMISEPYFEIILKINATSTIKSWTLF